MANAARNESHYDKAYASSNLIKVLIKLYFSYDQLSKTRRNLAAIEESLNSSTPLSIFDYGFGLGTFLYRVPRIHEVSGCELSSEANRNINRMFALLNRNIRLFHPDEFLTSPHAKKYDLVCCSHVLEHVENDSVLLTAFHNQLCDGGRLLLNVPINEVWKDPNHIHEYCSESIQHLLGISGFTIESAKEADRWTAYILENEQVSRTLPRPVMRILRFLLAPLPISLLDVSEKVLPARYQFQQMIVVARKS